MTIKPVTYISNNLDLAVGVNDFLAGVRVVPARRDGSTLYGRTLDPREPDSGERNTDRAGRDSRIPCGEHQHHDGGRGPLRRPGSDGYSPVANTVWT